MKTSISILLVLLFCSQANSQIDAKKVFTSHIENVEKFINLPIGKSIDGDEFLPSVMFLEELTGIECDTTLSFDPMKEPSKKNLKAWKKWYGKNKDKLYWDDIDRKVKVKV